MRKSLLFMALSGLVALLVLPGGFARAASATQCTGLFAGTATDIIVPAGGFCVLEGATVKHDVTVMQDAVFFADNTTIGHDVIATAPQQFALGYGGVTPGPVTVGHDVVVRGSDAPNGQYADVCDTKIGHDLKMTGLVVQEEVEVGDTEFCNLAPAPPVSVGHDATISGNTVGTAGFGFVDVGNNTFGHDLTVSGNTLQSGSTGWIDISDNTVGHDATCSGNNPPPSKDGPDDGPNAVAHADNGCG